MKEGKTALIALLILVLITGIIGFGIFFLINSDKNSLQRERKIENENILNPMENFFVNIYLDVTLSMKGYALTEKNSYFYDNIMSLQDISMKTFSSIKNVNWFKFGDSIERMISGEYLKIVEGSFYESSINKHTYLEFVFEKTSDKDLSIIITDLYQDSTDIIRVVKSLENKKNISIAIVGLRYPYNGTIYDLGMNIKSVYYRSDNSDTSTFRPLYFIIVGNNINVEKFVKNLKMEININDDKILFLANRYSFDIYPNKKTEIKKDERGRFLKKDCGYLFDKKKNIARITVKSRNSQITFTEKPNFSEFVPQFTLDNIKYFSSDSTVSIKILEFNKDLLEYTLSFENYEKTQKDTIEIYLSLNSFKCPKFVTNYSMSLTQIQDIYNKGLIGTKTLNLERFIKMLSYIFTSSQDIERNLNLAKIQFVVK